MEIQVLLVLLVLGLVFFLFVTEMFRVDVVAILVALILAWFGLITPMQAFSGFASTAAISIMGVMILGAGIEQTGVTSRISRLILKVAGTGEQRLIGTVSLVVGGLSGFMPSVGATALFLPALMRISKQTRIPASRLLMPIGFAAILGGTLTMVGSSALIVVNDLLMQAGIAPLGFFAVTPIGVPLLLAGLAYFYLSGRFVLPSRGEAVVTGPQEELIEAWHLPCSISYLRIPQDSPLIGVTREEARLLVRYGIHVITIAEGGDTIYAPWRQTRFAAGQVLGLLGSAGAVERLALDYGLEVIGGGICIGDVRTDVEAGFAEVVIRPRASIIGKTPRELSFRKRYGVEPIILISGPREERASFSDQPLQAGDTLVVHGRLEQIRAFGTDKDFVLVTPIEWEAVQESKAITAVLCFIGAIGLIFVGVPIALAMFSGALAMVLLRVISIDEAYRAIDWRTIFLIAGLVPLGIAMDASGAAVFLVDLFLRFVEGQHLLVILIAVAVLTTVFSILLTNIAAAVLLVPLAVIMADSLGVNPQGLALIVGLSTLNSFLLPTHQVNALLMGPGGYHNRDYFRAGGLMTILYTLIVVALMDLLYFT
ncbi:MAG: SLC13 family permease [Methanomicrobiaceae archaeon]|nr:SLC13 family permease [Methanomicrobiaceae archaeon]